MFLSSVETTSTELNRLQICIKPTSVCIETTGFHCSVLLIFFIYYACQSEQEKQLMRQVRKEERKEERRQARRDRNAASDEQELDQETYLRAVGFDPDSMKVQRYTVMLLYFVSIFSIQWSARGLRKLCRYNGGMFFRGMGDCFIRLIKQQNGNVSWRRESARKGLPTTSGAQFAALLLVKPFVWFARAVVKWRSRSVAKSAYLSLWPPGYGVGDSVSSVVKGVCILVKTVVGVWAARLARSAPLLTALEYLVALTLYVYFCCCFLFSERLLFRQQPLRHYYHDQNGACTQVMFTLMCLMLWLRHNELQPSFQTPRYCTMHINPFTPNIHLILAKIEIKIIRDE